MRLLIIISSFIVCRLVLSSLKSAPIPIPWNTLSHALGGSVLSHAEDTAHGALSFAPTIDDGGCWCAKLLLRAFTVCPAQPRYLPLMKFGVTVFAGAAGCSKWVEVCILVERNGI